MNNEYICIYIVYPVNHSPMSWKYNTRILNHSNPLNKAFKKVSTNSPHPYQQTNN